MSGRAECKLCLKGSLQGPDTSWAGARWEAAEWLWTSSCERLLSPPGLLYDYVQVLFPGSCLRRDIQNLAVKGQDQSDSSVYVCLLGAWRWGAEISVRCSVTLHIIFESGSLRTWSSPILLGWVTRAPLGSAGLYLPSAVIIAMCYHTLFLCFSLFVCFLFSIRMFCGYLIYLMHIKYLGNIHL